MALLTVNLKPSRRLILILSLAHLVAASALWPLVLSIAIKLTGVALVVTSLIYYLRKDALLSAKNAVVALEISDEMQCTLTTQSDASIVCAIQGNTFVAPYLTVLNLKPEKQLFTRSVVIFPDAIDAETFRKLRVLLRWKWRGVS